MSVTIQLRPLQPLSATLTANLTVAIAHKFSLPCVLDSRLFTAAQLATAYYSERQQYLAAPLLQQLKRETAPTTLATLGVTTEDLFTTGKQFIFGEAEVGGKVAIISLARLTAKFAAPLTATLTSTLTPSLKASLTTTLANRLAVHELGHVFALRHCDRPRCVMQFSPQIAALTQKSSQFCPECAHTLAENLLKFWPANSQ
jgi:archaemetzincin